MHFTPTGSSWLNLVERFFADLTGDVIRAGSFASVPELVRDINVYLAQRNADPKPYKWKAQGADILAKIKRAREALKEAQGFREANSESAHYRSSRLTVSPRAGRPRAGIDSQSQGSAWLRSQ